MKYRISPDVHFRSLDGEVIILDGKGNTYLGLNKSGAVIWEIIAQGGSPMEAANGLVHRFDIGLDQSLSDVNSLVSELVENGLLLTSH